MTNVVLQATKVAIQMAKFISKCCDKMTNIDNTCILVHAYFVEIFKKTKILENLEQMKKNCTTNNLINIIKNSMNVFEGLSNNDLVKKVVFFLLNSASTFQGIKIKVSIQLNEKYTPFLCSIALFIGPTW
jgi:hypothetical protein